jgi:hypothetical protein
MAASEYRAWDPTERSDRRLKKTAHEGASQLVHFTKHY